MYAEHGELVVRKYLPENPDDLIEFYRENVRHRDCAFHLRMRTHGDIDLLNCHPYEVLNKSQHGIDLYLMHNGVLDSGNKKDVSRSDTYHYINDYLRPLLARDPDLAFTEKFRSLIGKRIGSFNKFVLMDNQGRQSVVNQADGVYWSGLWLSNTYAWTAPESLWLSQPVPEHC